MHILFLSHNFPPEVNALATRTHAHCRRWVADGHQVTVVTCAPNYPQGVVFPGYRNAWRSEEQMDGIRVVRVGTLLAPNEGFVRRIIYFVSYMLRAALFSVMQRNVDVVVASTPQFFAGWAGVICKWLRRWPLVLEVRDLWPESIIAVGVMKRTRVIRMLEWLERRMYRAANHIVTVGEGYRRQLLERGVADHKISVVPNGVDSMGSAIVCDRDQLRASHHATNKFVCAYIGTVGMAHGLQVVIEAADALASQQRKDVVFWIVGDGAERQGLEQESRRRGLTNIQFFGMVAKDRVAQLIACADACLVHLRGTALFGTVIPSKIFEIMDANVPIIMGVRGEARDIVVDQGAGVEMTPDCAASLLASIDQIASDPQSYGGGRDFVVEYYNRDTLARNMLTVLQQQAGRKFKTTDFVAVSSDEAQATSRRAA